MLFSQYETIIIVKLIFLMFYLECDIISIQQVARGLFDAFSNFARKFNFSCDVLTEIYFVLDKKALAYVAQNEFFRRVCDQTILSERQITAHGTSNVKKTISSLSVDIRADRAGPKYQRLTQIGVQDKIYFG